MIVMLLSLLAFLVPAVSMTSIQEGRVEKTRARLLAIRRAIIGDPNLKLLGSRTSYGFLGDMGRVPASIDELVTAPGGAGFFIQDPDVRFSYGWNGPYLDDSDPDVDWTLDAWENALDYVAGTSTTPTTITSYGADGIAGGGDQNEDLVIQILPEATSFTLHGFVTDSGGGVFSGTGEIFLNDLDGNGELSAPIPTPIGTNGYFVFEGVTLGKRSVSLAVPSPGPTATVGPVTVTPGGAHFVLPSRHLEAP